MSLDLDSRHSGPTLSLWCGIFLPTPTVRECRPSPDLPGSSGPTHCSSRRETVVHPNRWVSGGSPTEE